MILICLQLLFNQIFAFLFCFSYCFISFLPPQSAAVALQGSWAQSQGRLQVPRWRDAPEEHTECCSPRFCTHQVSWHFPDLPAAHFFPLGLPPPQVLVHYFPKSSVWAYSISLQSCPLPSLLCSFHMFHLPSSFLISLGRISCRESTCYLWRQSRAKIWEGVVCPVPAGPASPHCCKQCLGCCSWK